MSSCVQFNGNTFHWYHTFNLVNYTAVNTGLELTPNLRPTVMKQQYFLLQIQHVIHITPLQTYLQS